MSRRGLRREHQSLCSLLHYSAGPQWCCFHFGLHVCTSLERKQDLCTILLIVKHEKSSRTISYSVVQSHVPQAYAFFDKVNDLLTSCQINNSVRWWRRLLQMHLCLRLFGTFHLQVFFALDSLSKDLFEVVKLFLDGPCWYCRSKISFNIDSSVMLEQFFQLLLQGF